MERQKMNTRKQLSQSEEMPTAHFIPFTSSQSWFLNRGNRPDPHYYNLNAFLEISEELNPHLVDLTFRELVKCHDALRLRFLQDSTGWKQYLVNAEEVLIPIRYKNLSHLTEEKQVAAISAEAINMQTSLHICDGPLLQIALFDLGAQKPDGLLLIIHHLIGDNYSLQILIQDFYTIYQQLSRKEQVQLSQRGLSFSQWAWKLDEHAQSERAKQEFYDYWQHLRWDKCIPLPLDYPEQRLANTIGSLEHAASFLSVAETKMLMNISPTKISTQDLLLIALAQSFATWANAPMLYVSTWNHGRIASFENIVLPRTVGFIAHGRRFLFDLANTTRRFAAIKEQIIATPHQGDNFELLSFLNRDADIAQKMSTLPACEVEFNFVGKEKHIGHIAEGSLGPMRDPNEKRDCILKCNCAIREQQLYITWEYSNKLHRLSTIDGLAKIYVIELLQLINMLQG